MKLSIITINYNNLKGLEKTIESVITQTYGDFEYLVIDGGSNDGSKELIERSASKMSYWVSEKDKGIYNAMNKGISKAKGEYLLFLNSGDYFIDSSILKTASSKIKEKEIIFGDGYIESSDKRRLLAQMPQYPDLSFFSKTSIFHPSTFIKSDLFDKYGLYNENNKIVSDWEFFIKTILINNVTYKKIPVVISVIEEDGISRNPAYANVLKDEIKVTLKKYFTDEEIQSAHNKPKQITEQKPKINLLKRLYKFLK